MITCSVVRDVTHLCTNIGLGAKEAWLKMASQGLASALAVSLLAAPASCAAEGSNIVRLPASANPELFAAQKTMVEAWTIVRDSFVDSTFNNKSWEEELRSHMNAAYGSGTVATAYGEISKMLNDLGDPYTRLVPPEEYANFRVSADGELQGVGLLIANEPVNGHLLVLAPIKGGPADRAGMLPGDEVVSINDESTDGWTGERAAKVLRGKGGTAVNLRFFRPAEGIPGVPGRPETTPNPQYREVMLERERVALSPVVYTTLTSDQGDKLGYIRLSTFSSNAAADMKRAIQDLEVQHADGYILDLRSNPGGLVRAGMDIARLWLDGAPTIFNVSGRGGEAVQQVGLESVARAVTSDPMVVLVNGNSASASEILSGALHDLGRASLVGSTTYGKGRIQSVYELQDGSALFVTVAKYQTPNGTDIDKIGVKPERACAPPGSNAPDSLASVAGAVSGVGELASVLGGDDCVRIAEGVLHSDLTVIRNTAAVAAAMPMRS